MLHVNLLTVHNNGYIHYNKKCLGMNSAHTQIEKTIGHGELYDTPKFKNREEQDGRKSYSNTYNT